MGAEDAGLIKSRLVRFCVLRGAAMLHVNRSWDEFLISPWQGRIRTLPGIRQDDSRDLRPLPPFEKEFGQKSYRGEMPYMRNET